MHAKSSLAAETPAVNQLPLAFPGQPPSPPVRHQHADTPEDFDDRVSQSIKLVVVAGRLHALHVRVDRRTREVLSYRLRRLSSD